MEGFIKLHRKVQKHWIYDEKRKFSKYEAWLDMLMMANHKDNKFVLGNELIELTKGQFVTSELKLMERWDWGKAKLRSFLELLEKDEMIVKISDRKKTTITICNYSLYHAYETENRPQADHEQTASRPLADTNKNVKKEKKEKDIHQIDSQFAEFWDLYPNKKGKAKAEKLFKTKLKKHSFESIMVGLRNYVDFVKDREKKHILHGDTFLNQDRFLDEYETKKNPNDDFTPAPTLF